MRPDKRSDPDPPMVKAAAAAQAELAGLDAQAREISGYDPDNLEAVFAEDARAHSNTPTHLADIVSGQAGDEGLWFEPTTAPEGYLQQELRRLHKAIEDQEPDPPQLSDQRYLLHKLEGLEALTAAIRHLSRDDRLSNVEANIRELDAAAGSRMKKIEKTNVQLVAHLSALAASVSALTAKGGGRNGD